FDFGHLRWHGKSAAAISLAGVALPFTLGYALARAMHAAVAPDLPPTGFALFLGTALSITAIPILGRMMMELNITRTRLGAITIAAAAVDDATGWILLATVAAIVRAEFDPAATFGMIGWTVAFALGMAFLAGPLLRRWVRFALRKADGEIGLNSLAILLAVICACAIATNLIGIFAIFGAFVLGAVLSGEHQFRQAIGPRLHGVRAAVLLPHFLCVRRPRPQ